MQSSYWGYWLIVMGVAIIGLMVTVNGLTTNSTQNFLSVREIADASMLESVDYGYYRDYNEVKINKEKFMEVFTRMLSETQENDTYTINFYALYEAPPKVSVEVISNSGSGYGENENYDVVTRVDAILQIYAEEVGENPVNPPQVTEPEPVEPPTTEPEEPEEPTACVDPDTEITEEGKGVKGLSLSNSSKGSLYPTLNDAINKTNAIMSLSSTASRVDEFTIQGASKNYNQRYLLVDYNGQCGWVDGAYMAVNMRQYLPSIGYSITNSTGSIFKVKENGGNINGVTGVQLYNKSKFDQFVPLSYIMAKKIKYNIMPQLANKGYTLQIYDAYRPVSVSNYVAEKVYSQFGVCYGISNAQHSTSDIKSNCSVVSSYNPPSTPTCSGSGPGNYWQCYDNYMVAAAMFIARNDKSHNVGCGIDVTLVKNGSPITKAYSTIHNISSESLKYIPTDYFAGKRTPSVGFGNSQWRDIQYLSDVMLSESTFNDIFSEWWHYEDSECQSYNTEQLNFWSNV